MRVLNSFAKSILFTSLITVFSCTNNVQQTPVEFGIDNNSIQLGIEESNKFVKRDNKTFNSTDNIILKFKANGLTVKENKVKVNIDLFLKKDKDILGTETDLFGKEGLQQTVNGGSGNAGSTADIQLTITPPAEIKGNVIANITLKDLNNSGKLVAFETPFTLN